MRYYLIICCFALLVQGQPLLGQQSKDKLLKQKEANLKKISESQKILKQVATKKKVSLGQLNAINQQIKAKKGLIRSISDEIKLLNTEISDINSIIESLTEDLDKLKKEYAAMVFAAAKANNGAQKLTFLFASDSFFEFWRKLNYLKQYADARKNQMTQITKVKDALTLQKESIEAKKEEQRSLLNDQITANKSLLELKNKQDKVIGQLSSQESKLRTEIEKRKKANQKLDQLIADIVKSALKEKVDPKVPLKEVTANFAKRKSKLAWPVGSGFISSPFGKHPHPVLKNLLIENQGVDIQTKKGESVKVVHNGVVKTVAFVPGMNQVVIVQHGTYFTLYARMKSVTVKTGQYLEMGDAIGSVYTDKDGVSELQFQIWKNQVKLDPQKWLFKK